MANRPLLEKLCAEMRTIELDPFDCRVADALCSVIRKEAAQIFDSLLPQVRSNGSGNVAEPSYAERIEMEAYKLFLDKLTILLTREEEHED